jgi:hypothetical protein
MPIRFRCPHCHQLLGIARRKSGSMVHCPTCNASVLVPAADQLPDDPDMPSPPMAPVPVPAPVAFPGARAPASPPPPSEPEQGLFDRDDFDALLKFSVSGPVEPRKSAAGSVHTPVPATRNPAPEAPPAPALPPKPPVVNVDPLQALRPLSRERATAPASGILLTPTRATVLTVVIILLMAIVFGAGLIVGRFL